ENFLDEVLIAARIAEVPFRLVHPLLPYLRAIFSRQVHHPGADTAPVTRSVEVLQERQPANRCDLFTAPRDDGIQVEEQQPPVKVRAEKLHLRPPSRPVVLQRNAVRYVEVRQAP